MNEPGYDLVAHKHYRGHVINIARIRVRTGCKYFVKRDRKLRGVFAPRGTNIDHVVPVFHFVPDRECITRFAILLPLFRSSIQSFRVSDF